MNPLLVVWWSGNWRASKDMYNTPGAILDRILLHCCLRLVTATFRDTVTACPDALVASASTHSSCEDTNTTHHTSLTAPVVSNITVYLYWAC
jgi:hypothetical protein